MKPSADPAAPPKQAITVSPTARRRAMWASTLGSTVEFYEFTVYAYLAVIFAPQFFPADDPIASTLSALAVFGAAYIARPAGGLMFGALGDRFGRRPVLMTTIFLMGGASSLVGVLPTHAQVGVLAPVLLVILRLLQGLAAGGEATGALTYIVELAPPNRRAVYGSLPALGVAIGLALAALVTALCSAVIGSDMETWGWRVPFLLCIVLTGLCLLLRRRLEDTPEFQALAAQNEVTRSPIRDAVRGHVPDILRVTAMAIGLFGAGVLGKIYIGIYLIQFRDLPAVPVYTMLGVLLLVTAALFPIMGRVSERFGRRPIAAAGYGAFLVLSLPLYMIAGSTTSLAVLAPALLVFLAIEPFISAAVWTSFAELFPARTRYTSVSIGFNLGTIVAVLGPYVCGQLIVSTDWLAAPGVWGIGCALLGLIGLAGMRETRGGRLAR
ncbi:MULTISPECIES: MFS transporter [Actinomadura]|uniref:MFS transporter, MHS family, proline/betaine transporter n=1 Tax=Actinomadura madurae TaxID=1993 RepID=A0A1I5PPD7_9ACTN|nr:MFS transporter [Actinomadura madurae]SFP35933.1 MFS transporter, MHS family, proline/betaine transporter [Actinomadura madurae]SPT64004.1 Proline porter II [Actinomadura madurae]